MFKKSFALLACALLIPCSSLLAQSRSADAYGSGVHQYFSSRHQDAIMSLNNAIAEDSNNARAYYFRGLAKMGAGDSYGAKSDFQTGASLEAASSKTRTSSVNRSLERVQGGLRLEIEKTRRLAFGSRSSRSSSVASSIPVQSLPVLSTYQPQYSQPQMTGLVTYDAPASYPIVSSPIVSSPIVQPLVYQPEPVVYSQPIYDAVPFNQPVVSSLQCQPQTLIYNDYQTAVGGDMAGGFSSSSTFSGSVPTTIGLGSPAIVIEPAPTESVFQTDVNAASSAIETPAEEATEASIPAPVDVATPKSETVAQTPSAEEEEELKTTDVSSAPDEEVMGDAFGGAADENTAEVASEPAEDDSFSAAAMSEASNGEDAFGGAAEEAVESPASNDAFGGSADADATEPAGDDPFGAAAMSEPADAEDAFGGAAEEAVENPVSDDAFGGSADADADADAAEPAGNDPFGASAAEPTEDPFGAGASEPAEVPFGDSADEPAADPFGGAAEEVVEDPFGT